MNVMTTTRRLVAVGAAGAAAAAALVGVTSTTASAAPVSQTYLCENPNIPGVGPWAVDLVSDAPALEGFPQINAGVTVPAGPLGVFNSFTIPKDAHDTLVAYGVEDISFPDFSGTFGPEIVGVEGMTAKVSGMTDNGNGTHSFQSDGTNAQIEVPAAGVYDVLSPSSFTMSATVPGIGDVPVTCILAGEDGPGSYMTINVVKNDSTTTGSANQVTKGSVSKVKITVAASNEVPSGKVVVKKGTNKLGSVTLNDMGKAVFKHKFPVGKTKVTLSYKGDGYTNTSKSDPVIVKVVR